MGLALYFDEVRRITGSMVIAPEGRMFLEGVRKCAKLPRSDMIQLIGNPNPRPHRPTLICSTPRLASESLQRYISSISPRMRIQRLKLVISTCLILGAVIVLWAALTWQPPVRLRLLELTTDSHGLLESPVGHEGAYALIEVTNTGKRPVTYRSKLNPKLQFPGIIVLSQASSGWVAHRSIMSGSMGMLTLSPGERMTFVSMIDSDHPCRVSFGYSDRPPSRLWQRLPVWLSRRLPWGKPYQTVTTDTINWRLDPQVQAREIAAGIYDTQVVEVPVNARVASFGVFVQGYRGGQAAFNGNPPWVTNPAIRSEPPELVKRISVCVRLRQQEPAEYKWDEQTRQRIRVAGTDSTRVEYSFRQFADRAMAGSRGDAVVPHAEFDFQELRPGIRCQDLSFKIVNRGSARAVPLVVYFSKKSDVTSLKGDVDALTLPDGTIVVYAAIEKAGEGIIDTAQQ